MRDDRQSPEASPVVLDLRLLYGDQAVRHEIVENLRAVLAIWLPVEERKRRLVSQVADEESRRVCDPRAACSSLLILLLSRGHGARYRDQNDSRSTGGWDVVDACKGSQVDRASHCCATPRSRR